MAKISIITCTYNRSTLLPRTIESVLAQSFKDFDYLIINNGSTDNTDSVIKKYCEIDNRIRVVTRSYNEISENSFYNIRQELFSSSALYYMAIDDDDFMEPNTVKTLYKLIIEYNADVSVAGSVYFYPDGTKKNKFVINGVETFGRIDAMKELLKREKLNSAQGGKLYRKKLLENIVLPTVGHYRDIHREYRTMNNIDKIVISGEPLYYFYRHDKNFSGLDTVEQITPEKMRQHLEANAIRTEWLTENMPEIKDFVFYCELSFMISLYDRIHRLDVQSCFDIAQGMKNNIIRNSAFLYRIDFCTEREKEILKSI